jgi:tyrosyl-tRNA synthetase
MSVKHAKQQAVDVLPEGGLEQKLKLGRPLRVKLGVDPTSPDVHLGFAYVLERLADFQRDGHTVVLIVGDYTATRPGSRRSGRSSRTPSWTRTPSISPSRPSGSSTGRRPRCA